MKSDITETVIFTTLLFVDSYTGTGSEGQVSVPLVYTR